MRLHINFLLRLKGRLKELFFCPAPRYICPNTLHRARPGGARVYEVGCLKLLG